MRNRARLVGGLALVCLLAFVLSACGGGGGTGQEETTGAADPKEVSGTVTVWDIALGNFTPEYDKVARQLDAEFERLHPDVTIDHVAQPFEGYEPIYQAAFAGKQGPSVMLFPAGPAGVLRFSQGLEVLNDRISPEMQERFTNWSSATGGMTDEGDHYGIPIGAGGAIYYYNKDLFEKAGLPREFSPESWEEVIEAGEELKAAGIQPFTGASKEGFENVLWFQTGWQTANTPEQAIEMAEGEMPITDQAFADALAPLIEIEEAGLYPEDRFDVPYFPEGAARFGEGKGAMAIGMRSIAAYFAEYNEQLGEENVGVFLPPDSNFFSAEADWVWSIPKFAEDKDAAWAYVEFLAEPENIEQFVAAGVTLPNVKGATLPDDAPAQARQLVEWSNEMDTFINANSLFPFPMEAFTPEINEVLQGRITVEEAQASLQEVAERTARG